MKDRKVFIRRFLLVISLGVSLVAVTVFNIEHNSIYIGGTHYHGLPSDQESADRKIDVPEDEQALFPAQEIAIIADITISEDAHILLVSAEVSPDTKAVSHDISTKPLSFTGYLQDRNDTNTFMFALDSAYAVNIAFTPSDGDKAYYKIAVYDMFGTVLTRKMIDSEKLYSDTGNLYFRAGEYTVKIERGYSWSGKPYTLNVNISQPANTELESNNSPSTANMISLNEDIRASSGTRNDIDYFAFTLERPSSVLPSLKFHPARYSMGIYGFKLYELEMLNTDKKPFIFRGDGIPSRKTRPFILEAGTYIIAVSRLEAEEVELGLHEYTLRVEAQEIM